MTLTGAEISILKERLKSFHFTLTQRLKQESVMTQEEEDLLIGIPSPAEANTMDCQGGQ